MAKKEPGRRGSIMNGFDESKYSLTNEHGLLEAHEPIGGSSRRISIKEGLYLFTTRDQHKYLHENADGQLENKLLKSLAQKNWIDKKIKDGHSLSDASVMWKILFFKNYNTDY